MTDETEIFINYWECPECFLNFYTEDAERKLLDVKNRKKCDFCENNILTDKQLLIRRVDILDKASLSRLADLIKQLVRLVKFNDH